MSAIWIPSSHSNPCPVCGRTHDNNCLTANNKVTVLCHTKANSNSSVAQPANYAGGYFFNGKFETDGVMDRAVYVKDRERTGKRIKSDVKADLVFEYVDVADGRAWVRSRRKDDGRGGKIIWQEFLITDDRLKRHRQKGGTWMTVGEGKVREGKATQAERDLYLELSRDLYSKIHLFRISDAKALAGQTGLPIHLVEGETCALALLEIGIPATTSIGGSSAWNKYGNEHGNYIADLEDVDSIVLCPDSDRPGIKHMLSAEAGLGIERCKWLYADPTNSVWRDVVNAKKGLDVKDWIGKLRLSGWNNEQIRDQIVNAVESRRVIDLSERQTPVETIVQGELQPVEEATAEPSKVKAPKQSKISKELSNRYKNKLVFSVKHDLWFQYEAEMVGAWSPIRDDVVKSLIQKDLESIPGLEEGFSSSLREGVYALMKLDEKIILPKWETKQGLIPFKNGVFDMASRTFQPSHSPKNYLTYSLPRDYQPDNNDRSEIDAWLDFVFYGNPEHIKTFNCMAAAMIRRMWYLQKFLHLQGEPGGGKSTAQNLLKALMGDINTVATNLEALHDNKFETARLVDKPLCLMPDQDDWRGSIGTFLNLTGNDVVRVEKKNKDGGEFTYEGFICMSSNGVVFVNRTGKELTRRQILLEFHRSVLNRDPKFLERLISNLPGWTNYLLSIPEAEILATLTGEGATALTLAQWEAKKRVDSIAAWLDECCVFDGNYKHKIGNDKSDANTLFGSYQTFCNASGGNPKGLREFSELIVSTLSHLFPDRKFDKHRTKSGWMLKGIALRSDYQDDPFLTDILFPPGEQSGGGGEQSMNNPMNSPNPHEIRKGEQGEQFLLLSPISEKEKDHSSLESNKELSKSESEKNSFSEIVGETVHLVHQSSDSKAFDCSSDCSSTVHLTPEIVHLLPETQVFAPIVIGSGIRRVGRIVAVEGVNGSSRYQVQGADWCEWYGAKDLEIYNPDDWEEVD